MQGLEQTIYSTKTKSKAVAKAVNLISNCDYISEEERSYILELLRLSAAAKKIEFTISSTIN